MRLIDADAVRDVIYGMHANGKEGVENALRNTYGADLREILYEIYELPTACNIEQIRSEIWEEALDQDAFGDKDIAQGLNMAVEIIDKYITK